MTIASTGFNGGAGNYIEINHGGGYKTRYLHLRASNPFAAGIAVGVSVVQGQLIAYSGDTGGVQPHLHFDMKLNGAAFKPEPMSRVIGFDNYGYSWRFSCAQSPNDPSPYWTSTSPYYKFLPGANLPGPRLLDTATPLGPTDSTNWAFPVGDWNRDGIPDLIVLQRQNTATNSTEVHILGG